MELRILELGGGVLRLNFENGKEEMFIPNNDLDKAIKLMLKYFNLKTRNGISIKEKYVYNGWNWFPTTITDLFWYAFYPYIQYEKILKKINRLNLKVSFINKGRFWGVYSIYKGINKLSFKNNFFPKLYNLLQYANNYFAILKNSKKGTLFYTRILKNFRTEYLEKVLNGIGIKYIKSLNIDKKNLCESLIRFGDYYFICFLKNENTFRTEYNLNLFRQDRLLSNYVKNTIDYMEILISESIFEYEIHLKLLSKSKIKYFFSYDETFTFVYPIIYACKKLNIKTIAFQKGLYAKRQVEYMAPGLEDVHYEWFDKIIVWGEYWKNKLLNNPHIKKDSIMIGANKNFRFNYEDFVKNYKKKSIKNKDKLNILIPYEFLANTYKIGRYLIKLIDNGHTIYFKPRDDENIGDQIGAYFLPSDYIQKIKIAEKINDELMRKIDVIIGTQTTLLYDLLPFGKPIFILDTEYKMLKDMVDEGIAKSLKFSEISGLRAKVRNYKVKRINPNFYFNKASLKEVLKPIFLK